MGFLTEGNTFSWEEANCSPTELVRKYGIVQFLNIYKHSKDRRNDGFKWGDEVEYIVVWFDEKTNTTRLSLRAHEILEELTAEERLNPSGQFETLWRPEYGRFMVEGTPGGPFTNVNQITNIEASMRKRRAVVRAKLRPEERLVTVTNFPLLGAAQFGPYTEPHFAAGGPVAQSVFTPDQIIHPHHRFSTLTANIRERRGAKVEINVPLFRDEHTTSEPLPLPSPPAPNLMPSPQQVPYIIYADSMAFGMGCCCLQVTFQCRDIDQARYLYDQFVVLSPIMLALSAATPIFRGYLADTDARWHVIAAAVDDRTLGERGLAPLRDRNKMRISKSRYESVSCYISNGPRLRMRQAELNDIDLELDLDTVQQLLGQGIDEQLARHLAHLFIRDPLVIYRDKLLMDDEHHSDHFENIQSTNWQTVRFKPPPPGVDMGWRVEFRPMECQLSDFENAAFSAFIVLLNRAIITLDLDFYMPISLVDVNMKTAQARGASAHRRFHFRNCIGRGVGPAGTCGWQQQSRGSADGNNGSAAGSSSSSSSENEPDPTVHQLTIAEIFHGRPGHVGLIQLVRQYLDMAGLEPEAREAADTYVDFIGRKASGELPTTATWIREFVARHPDYKRDSVVSPRIAADLMEVAARIGSGDFKPVDLWGCSKT